MARTPNIRVNIVLAGDSPVNTHKIYCTFLCRNKKHCLLNAPLIWIFFRDKAFFLTKNY